MSVSVNAQSFEEYKKEANERFNQFKAAKQSEFEAYRTRVNQEFADYMRRAWTPFKAEPAVPAPPSPEPPVPKVAPQGEEPDNEPLPFAKVTPLPKLPPPPLPLLPTVEPDKSVKPLNPVVPEQPMEPVKPKKPSVPEIRIDYYGSQWDVPFDNSLKFSLRAIDENSVAEAWERLSSGESVDLVKRCIDLRDSLRLPDWGYIRLVEKLSDAAFPDRKNESALLQMFILTQSGYKVRIGRSGNRLALLIPFEEGIYNYSFVPIGGVNYYVTDRSAGSSIYVYDREFPREQICSLAIRWQPALTVDAIPARSFSSIGGSDIDAKIAVNRYLIDFYEDYPLSSHWNINANASLSDNLKSQLYPVLREVIAGKTKPEAANILLRFVQTGFEYMTDGEQFGIERSFFPDETFWYPYSDCEDRAILYSVLVRELLGCDVVLVHYPGHLATAVRFDEDVSGDHFDIGGEKYIVCDPTYIYSNIGMAMPEFKNTSAEIVKL